MNKKDKFKLDVVSKIDDDIIERNTVKRICLLNRKNPINRKRLVAICAIAASLLIVFGSVFALFKYFAKQVPIYRGMTVSSAVSTNQMSRPSASASYSMLSFSGTFSDPTVLNDSRGDHEMSGDYQKDRDDVDQEKPFGNESGQAPIEDVIEEEVKDSLEVQGAAEEIYYAVPNEDIYITVHIDNPDQFEIQSFTLNGVKYSSYMFEYGSDMENLILKVNVGDVEGIVEYTIDAIKYIDGTEIKDVRMDGDKTVRVGVATEQQPVATVEDEVIGFNDISFSVSIEDAMGLIAGSEGSLTAVLYDGETVVAMQEVSLSETTEVEFRGLKTNTVYQYAIAANYDALDGTGFNTYILTKKAFNTKAIVLFDSITVAQEKIDFGFLWDETFAAKQIDSIALYQGENKVMDVDTNAIGVSDLLSNTEYTLVASYMNGEQSETISLTFQTQAKATPLVEIVDPTKTQESVGFGITVTDVDGVGEITKIELLHGDDAPIVATSSDVRMFGNLLSGNTYTVKVTYTYDLNDGVGEHIITKTLDIKTEAKATPTVEIVDPTKTQERVGFGITVTDVDGVGKITKIELLHENDVPIVATSSDVRMFGNLLSGNTYTVKVTYTYDLNDGVGNRTIVKTLDIKTQGKTTPTVEIVDPTKAQESVGFGITVTDVDGVGKITKIELLHGEDAPVAATDLSVRTFEDLLSNNTYTVKVTYVYDLNDGVGNRTIVKTLDIKTETKATPTVEIVDPTKTQISIGFDLDVTDVDGVGKITKIELLQGENAVKTADTLDVRAFTGLTMYTKYTIRVHYRYDLNDGDGIHEAHTDHTLYTLPRFELTNTQISNIGGILVGDSLNLKLAITNPSGLLAESIVINGKPYYINPLGTLEKFTTDIWIDESFNVGNTEFVIEKITFAGELENYDYIPTANNTVECVINGELTVTDIKLVDELGNEPELVFPSSQTYFLVSFESATAYEIKSLVIGGKTYTDIEVVDANSVRVKAELSGAGIYAYELTSIEYGNEYLSERTKALTDLSTQDIMLFRSIVEITTADDLKNMGNSFYYYKLMNDIDLSGVSVENFGEFRGYFDGNNHTISGFTVEKGFSSGETVYLGLFQSASGIVKDLHIANVSVLAEGDVVYGGFAAYAGDTLKFENVTHSGTVLLRNTGFNKSYMGGLLGKTNYKTVSFTDCINQATLTGESTSYVGGFVGNGDAVFTNCKNLADVLGTIGGEGTGGFVGETASSTFENCENSGDISGGYTGGFVGYGFASFLDCENNGDVSGIISGGFIGNFVKLYERTPLFENCTNNGTVGGNLNPAAGGFIGAFTVYYNVNGNIAFANCHNTQTVISTIAGTGEQGYAGAFIGYMGLEDSKFKFTSTVTFTSCTNSAAILGASDADAWVGYQITGTGEIKIVIE